MSNKDEQFTFSWKLFTDWDFMVGNPETATTKHASIVTTMKVSGSPIASVLMIFTYSGAQVKLV